MRFLAGLLVGLIVGALAASTISFGSADDGAAVRTAAPAVEEIVLPVEARIDEPDTASPPVTGSGGLIVPVDGIGRGELVDTFTQSRGNGARVHNAIDIPAPAGTPVLAAAPGRVAKLFTSDAGGLTVYIRSEDRRWIHYYAHLQSYTPDLREGARVEAGTMIGRVGSTGNADPSAPHLHFAIMRMDNDQGWWEGEAVNPYPLLTRGSAPS